MFCPKWTGSSSWRGPAGPRSSYLVLPGLNWAYRPMCASGWSTCLPTPCSWANSYALTWRTCHVRMTMVKSSRKPLGSDRTVSGLFDNCGKHRILILVSMTLCVLLTGCSGAKQTPGSPENRAATSSTSGAGSNGSSGPGLIDRPKEVKIDGVTDPCTLISATQLSSLNTDAQPAVRATPEDGGAKGCQFSRQRGAQSFRLQLTPAVLPVSESMEPGAEWEMKTTNVAGFPALTFTSKTGKPRCTEMLDVAEGQRLTARISAVNDDLDMRTACARAKQVLEFSLTTLTKS
ncbi:DUF3558 domain-containing protein [Pseudonocardiaceae bacterium YIM PH 21723]|nr:DUF3558 domain-containing protein [Pseudonocardiaceae bacterium YIM PH 21723]